MLAALNHPNIAAIYGIEEAAGMRALVIGTLGEPADQMSVELSPDGMRALVAMLDPVRRALDLWIYDVRRGLRTRFTFDPANEVMGAWSPDGSRVVFNSQRANRFDLYQKASSGAGAEELLVSDDQDKEAYSWSLDSRFVAFSSRRADVFGGTGSLWTVPLTGERKPTVFLETEFFENRPRFSPDGRWLAYASNESGRSEVYVTPFPDGSGKWQVSTTGGQLAPLAPRRKGAVLSHARQRPDGSSRQHCGHSIPGR